MLSVLMSIYNESELLIRESVHSILSQTYKDFEFIIIDDNPDRKDVKEILDSFHDKRIIYFKNKQNIGLAMSMNKAVEIAKSDILIRMDADDIALPRRFEIEYNELIHSSCDFVFSAYYTIDEDGKYLKENINSKLIGSTKLSKRIAIKPSLIHHPTVMFTRSIFEKAGGYRNFPCAQDADLWMRMAECGCRFLYTPEILLKYRINSQSVTQKKWFKQQLTICYIYKLSFERLKNNSDTFSVENYEFFLTKNGYNNIITEQKLRTDFNRLRNAKSNKGLKSFIERTSVFMFNKILRSNYLIALIKRLIIK